MKLLRAFVGGLLLATSALADDATVAAVEIPQPIKDVILENYPKAVFISAEKKGGTDETIYAVRFKTLETVRTCEITSDGIVKKVEEVK